MSRLTWALCGIAGVTEGTALWAGPVQNFGASRRVGKGGHARLSRQGTPGPLLLDGHFLTSLHIGSVKRYHDTDLQAGLQQRTLPSCASLSLAALLRGPKELSSCASNPPNGSARGY